MDGNDVSRWEGSEHQSGGAEPQDSVSGENYPLFDARVEPQPSASPPATEPPDTGLNIGRSIAPVLREIAETIIPAIIIALLIHVFLGQATRVIGQSMEPNLYTDMRLVVEKLSYRMHGPERGDIVVLRVHPGEELLIKRVIGLPGEEISVHDGRVYINGEALDEPYLNQETRGNMASQVVPPLHVFVMGDNRRASNDSRSFGPVHLDNIIGRAWVSYWPVKAIGVVE